MVDGGEERHPSREALWQFMAGGLSPAEMRLVLRHLLRGCRPCQEQAREVWNVTVPAAAAPGSAEPTAAIALSLPVRLEAAAAAAPAGPAGSPAPLAPLAPLAILPAANPAPPAPRSPATIAARPELAANLEPQTQAGTSNDKAYDTVLDRVFSRIHLEEAAVEAARQRAGGLFEELTQHPPARQRLLIENSVRFCDRMLCERLLAASHDEGFRDPAHSEQLARAAVAVAERLVRAADAPPPTVPASLSAPTGELLAGLRVRAWAQLGNALRIGSDHVGAAAAFRSVDALLAANPRLGLIDKARVFDLKASFCRAQRQFTEAVRLMDRVIAIYRRLGQSDLMGRALSQKGTVLLDARDIKGCMVLYRRALELIDPREDPRWFLIVRHNLISALVEDGQPREAFAMLFHTRPLYLKMGDRVNLLRLRWLEGRVAHGLQRLEQAEVAFREVRTAFVEVGCEYEAALVSLDLAAVLAQQGRTGEIRQLAQEMLVFFESRQIHREAMAAFLVFCNAAQIDQASLGLVREIADFLKQARHTPDLRFSPPTARS
jgi:tetratricopeptide (TPR) repeat protein